MKDARHTRYPRSLIWIAGVSTASLLLQILQTVKGG